MSLPIALELYGVKKALHADLEGTLEKVAKMGFDGVETAGLHDHTAKEFKAAVDNAGLKIPAAHVPFVLLRDNTEKTFEDYLTLGVSYIAVPYLVPEDRPESGNFDRTIESIVKIAEYAKKQGIQLCYHNHDFEFVKIGDKYALDILYESIPADLLNTEFDTCWVKVVGEDPVKYLEKYSGRSPLVHLKDFKGIRANNMYGLIGQPQPTDKSDEFSLKPLGQGVQDIPAIVKAAKDAGAKWLVIEQDDPSDGHSEIECAAMGFDYLASIVK